MANKTSTVTSSPFSPREKVPKADEGISLTATNPHPNPLPKGEGATLYTQGLWLMLYALTYDLVCLLLLALVAFMTAEALIPGFVSSHLNLAKFLFVLAALCFALEALGHTQNISLPAAPANRWLIGGLLIWSLLLIINSLIKFPIFAIVITIALTASIGWLLYQYIFEKAQLPPNKNN